MKELTTECSIYFIIHFTKSEQNMPRIILFFHSFSFLVPASVVVYPKSQTLNEGDTLLLTCAPNGDPLPNITWTMWNGTEVISNDPVLFINHITRINDGAYVCTASNGVGKNATGMARVRVTCKYYLNYFIVANIFHHRSFGNCFIN